MQNYFTYILTNKTKTVLYTGANGALIRKSTYDFLGVLFAGYAMPKKGIIESVAIPSSMEQFIKIEEMIDLGLVIKSDQVVLLIKEYLKH